MARIVSTATSGVDPDIMEIEPVSSSKKVLEKAGLSFDDIDLIELNEAFVAPSIMEYISYPFCGSPEIPSKEGKDL